MDYPSL